MTNNPSPKRKKAALILMCIAPVFAISPLLVSMIAHRMSPECSVVPNCSAGALAYFILLTVPIGLAAFIVGLVMLLTSMRKVKTRSS